MTGDAPEGGPPVPSRLQRSVRRALPAPVRWGIRQRMLETRGPAAVIERLSPGMALGRLTPGTALVIDGFPRSGNSYARAAFQQANGEDVPIATHAHTPLLVVRAVGAGVPAIVLIREPRPVLNSVLQFTGPEFAAELLRAYGRYYRRLLPHAGRVVIGPFPVVTGRFGALVDECNERFGTTFATYDPTETAERDVAAQVEREARSVAAPQHFESVVPRPSTTRTDVASGVLAGDRTARRLLEDAEDVHDQFVAHARTTP